MVFIPLISFPPLKEIFSSLNVIDDDTTSLNFTERRVKQKFILSSDFFASVLVFKQEHHLHKTIRDFFWDSVTKTLVFTHYKFFMIERSYSNETKKHRIIFSGYPISFLSLLLLE